MSGRASFRSQLGKDMVEYIAVRRALGYKFASGEKVLRCLDRFMVANASGQRDLSVAILKQWMAVLQPQTKITRLGTVRHFCLFRRRSRPRAFVPDRKIHPALWPTRAFQRVPFIFTTRQIRELLSAAQVLPPTPRHPKKPDVMFMILLLLYSAGLRLSEGTNLRVDDINFVDATLRIRETKFFKSRLVPVVPAVLEKLRKYVRKHVASDAPARQPLFSRDVGPYSAVVIGHLGREVLAKCGFEPGVGRGRPRLHDLRHTFAVHRITAWYKEGLDVQSRLPFLATYLGHKDIVSVQRYVTVTGEILELAGSRFEAVCAPKRRK